MLCCTSILIGSLQLKAQSNCNATLKGKVIDANTGTLVSDAVIIIQEQLKGDHTNDHGEFSINKLCAGKVTLRCQHLNHESKDEIITLVEGNNYHIVYLTCHSDTLQDLTVKADRIHWEDVSVSNKLQLEALKASQGLSLGKALEQVNGVYTLNTGSNISKPVIRGMHSNRILIINNGIRQEGQQWGNEHAPEIDPSIAQNIEVIKGAQTIQYGSDIMGGIILINPKAMQDVKGLKGVLNSGFFSNGRMGSTNVTIENSVKQIPGLAWSVHASYKRGGNSKTPDYFLKNTGMKETNYAWSLGYHRKKWNLEFFQSSFYSTLGIFSGSHIGNLTDLYQAFERDRPIDSSGFNYAIAFPQQQIRHYLGKSSFDYHMNQVFTLHVLYGYQTNFRKEFDKNLLLKNNDGSYKPVLSFELNTHHVDVAIEHKELHHVSGRIGVNGFYQINNYFGNYFIPNYKKLQGGLFWTEKWHRRGWSVEAGVRYDINHFRIYKWENQQIISPKRYYSNWAGTLAARYQLPLLTIHLNTGSTWRAPFVNELYSYGVHHNAATFEMGDSTLVPERGYHASLTFDVQDHKRLDMEFTLFYQYIQHYITLQPKLPATLTIRGAFPTMVYAQTNTVFFGWEGAANYTLAKQLTLHARANTVYVQTVSPKRYLVGMPPARMEASVDVIMLQHTNQQLDASVSLSHTFKQRRVQDSTDYVAPPPAYTLLHVSAHAAMLWMHRNIDAYVGCNNVLNTRYRDYLNRNRYFADEAGRMVYVKLSLPLFPMHSNQSKLKQ